MQLLRKSTISSARPGELVILGIWHDPDTPRAIANSGGLGDVMWGVPLLLILIGLVAGTAGALPGRTLAAIYSSAKTKSA